MAESSALLGHDPLTDECVVEVQMPAGAMAPRAYGLLSVVPSRLGSIFVG